MINEYHEQLNIFSVAETRAETELYFEKYWLQDNEYQRKWLAIQETIFEKTAKCLPDLMFKPDFELLPLVGGNIFTSETDFDSLRNCMKYTRDNSFVIIQNRHVVVRVYYGDDEWRVHPPLRFKYPANISWDELMSGGYVSTELFVNMYKEYFVFGDSGNWGRYVANEYDNPLNPVDSTPLNIMGFKKEYSEVFRKNFEHLIEPEIISDWLPDTYKARLKHKTHQSKAFLKKLFGNSK